VAVIDSGIDYNHEDLQANIWTNPGETGGGKETNGIDDDANGYIDDWRGWNFVYNSNNPMDDYSPNYHGTHVAGTIGAKGNNSKGVVGVCWNVKLMALKWLDWIGDGTTANAIRAIDYSTANGARLSNNSWHVPNSSSLLSAIERAQTSGKLFISSAGNWNKNNDNKSSFSHYGRYTVDVGAPGGTDDSQNSYNIYSTKSGNAYLYLHGTSMAAPHVAGQAALIWAHRPALNWWKVKTIIMKSVDYKSSLSGKCASGGRINAYSALITPTPNLPSAPTNLKALVYGSDVKLTWKDNSANESGFEIYLKNGYVFVLYDWTGPNVTTYWDYDLSPGYYTYYVRAYNQDGNSTKTLYVTAKII
jgi:subtilisin family serine protease